MRTIRWTILGLALVSLISLAACSSDGPSSNSAASKTIVDYLQALVDRQPNRMTNLSCAAWEEPAQVEYDAFAAVKLELKNPVCKDSGQEGEFTLVNCSGSIIANYGAEDQKIDLAERTYKAVQEGGEWRMCGYK
jgi:hypothetical protein